MRPIHPPPLGHRPIFAAAISAALLIGSAGCGDQPPAATAGGRVPVYVTIPPQAYFVERVGGEFVDVGVLIGAGQSPHTFEPTARQMAAISTARVYFAIGAPFERRVLQRLAEASPNVNIVDTGQGVPRRMMEAGLSLGEPDAAATEAAGRGNEGDDSGDEGSGHGNERDDHGDESGHGDEAGGHGHQGDSSGDQVRQGEDDDDHADHAHAAGEPDPHIWLSPKLVKLQARHIRDALRRAAPEHAAAFDENLRRFESDLDAVDAEIAALLAPYRGRAILVFHPAYGYFTDAYGLRQAAVESEGKAPGPRQLASLIAAARERRIRVIFIQPQASGQKAEAIAAEIGARVAMIDPMDRDYLNNLRRMAKAVAQALEEKKPGAP